jgi:superfamily II DNA or RNA helicase
VTDSVVDPLLRIQQSFGDVLYGAAERLVEDGSVVEVRVLQAGNVVTGIVDARGDGGGAAIRPMKYRVYIRDRSKLEGECSCGAREPCVHVAAVSIAAVRTVRAGSGGVGRGGSGAGSAGLRGRHGVGTGAASVAPSGAVGAGGAGGALRELGNAYMARGSGGPARAADAGAAQRQRLYYVFEDGSSGPRNAAKGLSREFRASVWVAQEKVGAGRGGGVVDAGSACLFVPRAAQTRSVVGVSGEYPRYVDAADREILGQLTAQQGEGPWGLSAAVGADVLVRAVATGRAYFEALQGLRLCAGLPRQVTFEWEVLQGGEQRLCCSGPEGCTVVLDMDPPMYLDLEAGEVGMAGLPCPVDLLRRYAGLGPLQPEQIFQVNAAIEIEAGEQGLPLLRRLQPEQRELADLRPRLVLSGDGEALVYFIYNGAAVDGRRLQAQSPLARQMVGEALWEISRDLERERGWRSELAAALEPVAAAGFGAGRERWLTFMLNGVPALQANGWEVVVDPEFAYRLAPVGEWYGDVGADQQSGWFNLKLGVTVDGLPVNLLPALTSYLQATPQSDTSGCRVGEYWLVHLPDGRFLPISLERIQRIADTLVELLDQDSLNSKQGLSLPQAQSGRLAQLVGDLQLGERAIRSEDPVWQPLLADLRGFGGISAMPAPASFRGKLRSYQEEGLGWLQFLRRYRLGGILADDMGLGKTVQTIAHIALEIESGRLTMPVLIVAPVSALGNWRQEIARFAPALQVLTWHGTHRRRSHAILDQAHIVITAYPLLLLDSEVFLAREFGLLILDEAQMIKNPRAKISQMARSLRAVSRVCLSGTPIENHLGELWSLFDFLQPGLLGEERHFQRQYRTPIEKNGDRRRAQALSARLAPFLLRRTKDSVAKELPPKQEMVESILLDEKQRDFYDGIRLAMHQRVQEIVRQQGLARSQITILDALLKLRQACCDPRLVALPGRDGGESESVPSAKLDWLRTVLPELIEEGRRILLFSQFTSMLALIESMVSELGISYCLLTGATQDRTAVVDRFQSGSVPLFLISLKAGGTALNLTAADTVIHYDPWWNPAVEAQATDRAHRIGQTRPVFVYKLIAQGTVEERMLQLQADKRVLASSLYTDKTASPTAIGAEDLELLFAP